MFNINHLFLFLSFSMIQFACETSDSKMNHALSVADENQTIDREEFSGSSDNKRSSKVQNELIFHVDIISGVNFLERTGSKLTPNEKEELANEFVLKLEVNSVNNKIRDLLKDKSTLGSNEESMKYILSGITNDLFIKQGENKFYPTGVELEQGIVSKQKFALFLFFKNIDLNEKIDITYYDLLFGTGIQKFSIDKIRKHDS